MTVDHLVAVPSAPVGSRPKHWLSVALWLLLAVPAAAYSNVELYPYITKHRTSALPPKAMVRLRQYAPMIHYFAGLNYFRPKHQVSAEYIKALILAESSADRFAVSPANALGLGQILLSTGRQAGRELYDSGVNFRYVSRSRLRHLERDDLFDPAINILITCYLTAKYNEKFNGRIELVLSAWNAGEYTESLSRGRHAPYTETRNLIGRVNAYYLQLLRLRQRTALR